MVGMGVSLRVDFDVAKVREWKHDLVAVFGLERIHHRIRDDLLRVLDMKTAAIHQNKGKGSTIWSGGEPLDPSPRTSFAEI
jgi:hypothetical protein